MPKSKGLVPQRKKKKVRRKTDRMTAETRRRLEEVMVLLAACVPTYQIETQKAKAWGVKVATVRDYIDRAHEYWEEIERDPKFQAKRRSEIRLQWQHLYMRAMQKGDHATARYALREMGQMDGCYAPQETTVQGHVAAVGLSLGHLGFKSSEEVRQRIEDLKDRIEKNGTGLLLPPKLDREDE